MGRTFIEKRIIRAGIALCKERIDRKGTPITADDLRNLKVKTFSPFLQGFYITVGVVFLVFGIWAQGEMRNMALSFPPVLIGFGNICFGVYGRPVKVADLGRDVDLMELSSEILRRFVEEMDASRERRPDQ